MDKQRPNIVAFPGARGLRGSVAGTGERCNVIDLAAKRPTSASRSKRPLIPGEVWDALREDRFEMHYQPQYDLVSGRVVAAEALVRLVDTAGDLVYPDRFIEMVELSDLIVPLGRLVIERVCRDLATAREAGAELPRVAVNVSVYQLEVDPGLVDFVAQVLALHGLDFEDLEFELTERQCLKADSHGVEVLRELTIAGSRVVIDDFGIGASSIMYLTELPVSAFKLDRALISQMPEDGVAQSVAASLLALGANIGVTMVGEGVETDAQRDCLVDVGCKTAQGYALARPMPLAELSKLLKADQRHSWAQSIV